MSGGSLEYVYYRIEEAAERVKEELDSFDKPRPPKVKVQGVAAYEISEDRKSRSWWWDGARFDTFTEAEEYFTKCINYEIQERNTMPNGERQLILRDKFDKTLYDVHSYTDERYEADEDGNIPYFQEYGEETVAELRNGLDILRKAAVYAERIEWLLSSDDSEESFLQRLKEDLKKIAKERN